MSMENITKLMDELKDNPKVQALFDNAADPETLEEEVKVYADAAKELGIDVTEDELKEYVQKVEAEQKAKTEADAASVAELDAGSLEKVSGGKEICTFSYKDKENCWRQDGCDIIFIKYHDYICKRTHNK